MNILNFKDQLTFVRWHTPTKRDRVLWSGNTLSHAAYLVQSDLERREREFAHQKEVKKHTRRARITKTVVYS